MAFNLHGVRLGVTILFSFISTWSSQVEKHVPAMQETQETWVRSRVQEEPVEKGMATHSSILAWETPWTEEPGGLQSMDGKELETTERLSAHTKSNFTCTNKIRAGGKNHGTRESCISEGSVSRPSQSPSSQVLQGYSWSCFHILKVHCDKQRHRRAG